MNKSPQSNEPLDFSLALGGPLFQILVRSRLATPTLGLMERRIVCFSAIAWLPLLLFSLVDGKAWGGVGLPFLYDVEKHARLLVALPLLIGAEMMVHRRLSWVVRQFVGRDIITAAVLPKFKEVIASAMKLRNSVACELILFILIFIGGYYLWTGGYYLWTALSEIDKIGTGTGTWYATVNEGGTHLSPAGYWYFFVSRPLIQFIIIRWYFRLFIWARFLWQSSRLELNLIPTHPDGAAGLGFLGGSSIAFALLLMAHGVMLAGLMANSIFFAGAKLTDFNMEIFGYVAILLLMVLGPLLFFSPYLFRARRKGLREYGVLASRYVSEFDLKWLRGGANGDEQLIGSADIQSLADLANSFKVIGGVNYLVIGKDVVIWLVGVTLVPLLPLSLTLIPVGELIRKFLRAVF